MKILLVEPGKHPRVTDIPHTLEKMQARLHDGAEILDPTEWHRFLARVERRIDKLMQEDPEA